MHPATDRLAPSLKLDLSGTWALALDPTDCGEEERWYAGDLPAPPAALTLPGSLQAQGFGDAVDLETPWTGTIVDRSFFTEPHYAPYRQPGQIKLPFWLQPEK